MKKARRPHAPDFLIIAPALRVRALGQQYFQEGRVTIDEVQPDYISASVRGTRVYAVDLVPNAKGGEVWCSCPYFDDHAECKHIWALMLTLEKLGLAAKQQAGGMELLVGKLAATQFLNRLSRAKPPVLPVWQQKLQQVRPPPPVEAPHLRPEPWPDGQVLLYAIEPKLEPATGNLLMEVLAQRPRLDGLPGVPRSFDLRNPELLKQIPTEIDRQLVGLISGLRKNTPPEESTRLTALSPAVWDLFLPLLAQTGRLHLKTAADLSSLSPPYSIDPGAPWEFHLIVDRPNKLSYAVTGAFVRGEEHLEIADPALVLEPGWLFAKGRISRLNHFGGFGWIDQLRNDANFMVPTDAGPQFLEPFLATTGSTPLRLPHELQFEKRRDPPQPWIKISKRNERHRDIELKAEVSFDYDGVRIAPDDTRTGFFRADARVLAERHPEFERTAMAGLLALGFRIDSYSTVPARASLLLNDKKLAKVVATLIAIGWKVEAEGKLFRTAGQFKIDVRTGIDWFELHGTMDFDGVAVSLPALLAAARKGDNTVLLDDGSFGMLPEEWLNQWGVLAGAGTLQADHIRYRTNQAALLDALLATRPEADCDELFRRVRESLKQFDQIAAAEPPATFQGTLRDYQRDGLGWLHFLRGLHFGGCLADDMGLGKTVQVLALLESIRARHDAPPASAAGADGPNSVTSEPEPHRPSLAVVPRSVLYNWRLEAEKFAPRLRVREHIGTERTRESADFSQVDLLLTTYGTLRRDIAFLKDVPFDTVILDEAQAIKNASTAQAKAARLLNARHRLALSGTPVENHLGELWSLLEFLNPGLLGSAAVFKALSGDGRNLDEDTRVLLARALRPFILRRTKGQVAKDLPERTEQTLYCDLEGPQRKQYDELREHYRQALLGRVDEQGLKKSAIQVLEALLRLRQAACHPGLIDKARIDEPSAKLDALVPQLAEILEENHKALVFSQFTSFLAILRKRLDAEKIPYAYLDGKTRDREQVVHRFQNDPNCKLFLISLKAGGLGLNLTAAEYVFLLDPWWNPAVEAQAIDRTHRIGQLRQVFAYRLIARGTVEEKVLELQKTKRALADAIITQDNSLIRNLTRDDLALLLG